jgi:hypothetical protein
MSDLSPLCAATADIACRPSSPIACQLPTPAMRFLAIGVERATASANWFSRSCWVSEFGLSKFDAKSIQRMLSRGAES